MNPGHLSVSKLALLVLLSVLLPVASAYAQQVPTELAMQRRGGTMPAGYEDPFPPLHVIANVYYVGRLIFQAI